MPPEVLPRLARTVEAAGLDELWVWEDCFKQSAIASAATALALTERVTVGIGLMPAPLRNVALCAMETAMLARLHPGRLIAGVGHGVQDWMGQAGARVDSPLTLLREYATALRSLLAGEELTTDGRYVRLDHVRLDWPPDQPPPLYLGGSGPKSLRLAAELGDGVLLTNALSDEANAEVNRTIADVRGPGHPMVATLITATGPDASERLARELPLWGARPEPTVGVAGDADDIAGAIRRLGEIGATSVVIQPTADEPDLAGLIALIGNEVRSALG
jgi:alkanesulfonate monooxygenase SsuD/methylene tetrahydromethanopterin reductase-like flavin-dependent oxidoreductase (luciferase family)